jgi:hypothetical protein
MKIATTSWIKATKTIGGILLTLIIVMGVAITIPLWIISLGHINLLSKLDKLAEERIERWVE